MTEAVPELRELPPNLVLDGELVAFNPAGDPHFPLLSRRILIPVPIQFMVFDVLAADDEPLTAWPYAKRRALLEHLHLHGRAWSTPDTFDDGSALYAAVCERGLEGIVAKWRRSSYRPGRRDWIKIKNPTYWRRDAELNAMRGSRPRHANREGSGKLAGR